MKRMLLVTALAMLTTAGAGCNCLPSCFCRNDCDDYVVSDACQPCDPCTSSYGTAAGVEYVQPAAPVPTAEPLPVPGPAPAGR